MTDCI